MPARNPKMPPKTPQEARQAQIDESIEKMKDGILDAEWDHVSEDAIGDGWEPIEKLEGKTDSEKTENSVIGKGKKA
jgi:hypothetical protein